MSILTDYTEETNKSVDMLDQCTNTELLLCLTECYNIITPMLHKSVRILPLHTVIKIIDGFVLQGGSSIHFVDKGVPSAPYLEFLAMYAKSRYLKVSVDIDCSNYINTRNVDRLLLSFDVSEQNLVTKQEIFTILQINLKKYTHDMQHKTLCIANALTEMSDK